MKYLNDYQLEKSADAARATELSSLQNMLQHLKEIDRRRLFSKRGFQSLHDYAIKRFKYSPDQAHRRICAMQLVRDLPEAEAKILDGSLQLTHLTEARSFFKKVEHTKAEKLEVLSKLENTTKSQMKKILYNEEVKARYSFEADQQFETVVERLKGLQPHLNFDQLMEKVCKMALEQLDPSVKAERIRSREEEQKQKSQTAKLSSTVMPAVTRKDSNVPTERNFRASAESETKAPLKNRYISAGIKREVWIKAKGKCECCASTYALEYDHKLPFALGGLSTTENLRLLCRNCNQRRAIEAYGVGKMEKYLVREEVNSYLH